eukprot:CAMPEP_0175945198 /NCGR_PEP_ID=MMETSP0108-20121206/26573_1 /TAXON_ID=195067 ORGANISM="Goniomonas pacifica, Strain CCMP1869" /NCGR_SAMPLE_ID=MMETSP0108 /ASSEMBLY_ACC=CAM_ASM_000204 /LENGTH=61 /DNA_ID=CAMNT_0017270443 /DNA_START=754 /DNA_END=936 /DNA_ORIENTATION=+
MNVGCSTAVIEKHDPQSAVLCSSSISFSNVVAVMLTGTENPPSNEQCSQDSGIFGASSLCA